MFILPHRFIDFERRFHLFIENHSYVNLIIGLPLFFYYAIWLKHIMFKKTILCQLDPMRSN